MVDVKLMGSWSQPEAQWVVLTQACVSWPIRVDSTLYWGGFKESGAKTCFRQKGITDRLRKLLWLLFFFFNIKACKLILAETQNENNEPENEDNMSPFNDCFRVRLFVQFVLSWKKAAATRFTVGSRADLKLSDQGNTVHTLQFGLAPRCESALSAQEGPLLFMPAMSRGRRNRPSSAALRPRNYTSLQGLPCRKGHFPIIPQSVRPLLCTLMDQMDRRLAPSALRPPPPSLPPSLTLLSSLCVLSLPFPVCSALSLSSLPSLTFSLHPVFSILCVAVDKSLVISLWRTPAPLRQPVVWFSLELIFRAEWYFVCQCLCQSHTIRTQRVFQPALKLFILFSCERMELSRCITDLSFSGQAHCFPWLPHLKSVETGLFFFLHVYKWALFMNPWGNAPFLKGFKRILHYAQSGALDLCSIFTHSIILRLIWYGWARCIWIAMVFIKMACQSAADGNNWSGDERG